MLDPNTNLVEATAAYNAGDWQRAFDLANPLLAYAPEHAGLHYVVGLSALGLKQMPLAIRHLQRALRLEPKRGEYAAQFARALSLAGLASVALAVVDRALTFESLDASSLDTLAVVLSQANEHQRACELYARAVALAPERVDLRYNLAKSLVSLGRLQQAEDEMETCLAMAPQAWDIHLTLAQVRRQTATSNHLQRLHELLPQAKENPLAQLHLHMALYKECEDLADYPKAFAHLDAGKEAGCILRGESLRDYESIFDALLNAPLGNQPLPTGFASSEPIFVMGMPRTGTTLVERILSSHPLVHSAGELTNFSIAFKFASGKRDGELLDAATIDCVPDIDWYRLGESYVASTRPATAGKPHFVDKLPQNFLYAGFIAQALPNAKIICLRRDPMDTCLNNFQQKFSLESWVHDYTFDLLATGRYYVRFDRLMAHWQQLFPGRILEVQYETLVDAQEEGTRRLLEFCGLPWDDACLHFEKNAAPVATASAVQVRQPMYRSSVGRWRNYAAQSIELRRLLVESGIAVDDRCPP